MWYLYIAHQKWELLNEVKQYKKYHPYGVTENNNYNLYKLY
jgi:hypothetical protein